jgi:hypothetical protein
MFGSKSDISYLYKTVLNTLKKVMTNTQSILILRKDVNAILEHFDLEIERNKTVVKKKK